MFIDPLYIIGILLVAIFMATGYFLLKNVKELVLSQDSKIQVLTDDLRKSYTQVSTMAIEISIIKKEIFKLNSKRNSKLNSAKKLSLSIAQHHE